MLNNENTAKIFHEIKNSVTVINSYLQLLEKKYPDIAASEYWSISKNEMLRLRSIVTELSQTKFGCDLQMETIDLRDFVQNCCNSFRFGSDDDEILFTLSLPDYPLPTSMDTKQFHHAMINLLKNSSEAMHHRGEILIDATAQNQQAAIRITDSGCGIAPEIIGHIFEPFVTTKADGSGLGLNITKEIVTAHGGEIQVESQLGKGCCFTILLPLATDMAQ